MRPLALDSLRSVPSTTLAVLAAIFLVACAGDDLSTDDTPQPISAGGSSAGGQAGASPAGQGGAGAGKAGTSGTSGQSGASGKGGAAGQGGASGAGQAGMSGSSGQGGDSGAAGSAGETSGASSGGSDAGGAGSGGSDSGAAGDAGMAGASSEMGGAAGTDAGSSGAAGCDETTVFYFDQDNDGYGNPAKSVMMCPQPPGWVANKDDCNDDNGDVFVGQTKYFDKGYVRAGAPGGVSFDYDCNGKEEHDPGVDASSCSGTSLDCSKKGGAIATTRTGTGVDPICGSETKVECTSNFGTCKTGDKSPIAPVRCR